MENCLLTKLKGSVDNSSLPVYGALNFDVKRIDGATNINSYFQIVVNKNAPAIPVIKITKGHISYNNVSYGSGEEIPLVERTTDYAITVTLENEDSSFYVTNAKYFFDRMNNVGNGTQYPTPLVIDFSQFIYSPYLTALSMPSPQNRNNFYGKLEFRSGTNFLENINLPLSNVEVDIDTIHNSNFNGLNTQTAASKGSIVNLASANAINPNFSIYCFDTSIAGNVEEYAAACVQLGKTSGYCNIKYANSNVTCTHYPEATAVRVDFSSSYEDGYQISLLS